MSRYFTKNDEWAQISGLNAKLGLTKQGADHLGDVTFVELPKIGAALIQGEPICAVEAVKAAVDFYAPLSGRVIAVNTLLRETPELLNQSAEDEAWIVEIEITDLAETKLLLDHSGYQTFLRDGE